MKASVLFVVVALAVGCGGPKGPGGGGGGGAHDAYDSYPQLALIPADTPYAFVSFKRMPVAMARRMYAAIGPLWRDKPEEYSTGPAAKVDAFRKALADLAGSGLTPEKLAKLGMIETPRLSVYGVEGYPVFRLEIGDGAKMLAVVEDLAARAGFVLPPTTRRGDHTYWSIAAAKFEIMVSIAPKEIVASLAPPDVMARMRDVILGVAKPTASMSPAVFRELAAAHGFGGHGLGFLDTAKMIHTFAPPQVTGGSCGVAIDELAAAFPRLVLGFDVGDNRLGYRAIIELSAPVREALAGLATSIPKVAPGGGETPLITMTAAVDVDRARALLPRVADVLSDLSARCRIPDLGAELDQLVSTGWPPYLRGIHGASFVLTAMDEAAGTMEGSAVVHVADPQQLLSTLSATIGLRFNVTPNGKAVPILAGLVPYPLHLAMNGRSLALGVGPDSDLAAEAALGGPVEPAPLARITLDYAKFKGLPMGRTDAVLSAMELFGEGTFEVTIGDRGLVGDFSLELQ